MSRVVVTGGRGFKDRGFIYSMLDGHHDAEPISLLIHGCCHLGGSDIVCEDWAKTRCVPYVGMPAWAWRNDGIAKALATPEGREEGPKRNRRMLLWSPKRCIAFPGGDGTADMLKAVREYNRTNRRGPGGKPLDLCWITEYVLGPDGKPCLRSEG